jgi:Ca2+-binding RTX toxin-like protein
MTGCLLTALALLPAASWAGTFSSAGGTARYIGAPGEMHDLSLWDANPYLYLGEAGRATLNAGAGCEHADLRTVRCASADLGHVELLLGERNDAIMLAVSGNLRGRPGLTVSGGPGVDTVDYLGGPAPVTLDDAANDGPVGADNVRSDIENVVGTTSPEAITGSPAANRLEAREGRDSVSAGAGDDLVVVREYTDCGEDVCLRPEVDSVSCGPGSDVVDADRIDEVAADCELVARDGVVRGTAGPDQIAAFSPGLRVLGLAGADRLFGAGGGGLYGGPGDDLIRAGRSRDQSSGGAGDDEIVGGIGRDYIRGGAGADRLRGSRGNDRIDAGPGGDSVFGGDGGDVLRTRDGERDRVSCGRGADVAIVDRVDTVSRTCERVQRT